MEWFNPLKWNFSSPYGDDRRTAGFPHPDVESRTTLWAILLYPGEESIWQRDRACAP